MSKRLSNNQKEEIIRNFNKGQSIEYLSSSFNCTKLTIVRNLKKYFGEKIYKEILEKNKLLNKSALKKNFSKNNNASSEVEEIYFQTNTNVGSSKDNDLNEEISQSQFLEIAPLEYEIDNLPQKDLASIHISEVDLPNVVYMVVDKKIELETKYLKEYPEWQFLSQDELNRKTIEIYFDLKLAKRYCNKEQKVIKVPNTRVFKLAAPQLLNKGISRIVSFDKLIAL